MYVSDINHYIITPKVYHYVENNSEHFGVAATPEQSNL